MYEYSPGGDTWYLSHPNIMETERDLVIYWLHVGIFSYINTLQLNDKCSIYACILSQKHMHVGIRWAPDILHVFSGTKLVQTRYMACGLQHPEQIEMTIHSKGGISWIWNDWGIRHTFGRFHIYSKSNVDWVIFNIWMLQQEMTNSFNKGFVSYYGYK